MHDGKQIGDEYDRINSLMEIGGKPTAMVESASKNIIVYDGVELGGQFYNLTPRWNP